MDDADDDDDLTEDDDGQGPESGASEREDWLCICLRILLFPSKGGPPHSDRLKWIVKKLL